MIDEDIFIDPPGAGSVRTDGRMNIRGKSASNRLQVLHNPRTGPINIGPVFEHHEDIGIIEHGLRAYRFHSRRSQQCSHNRIGDLIFDDVGWLALPVGVNDHLHVRNVRQSVEGYMANRPHSRHRKQKHSGEDQEAIVCAPLDDSRDHVTYLPWHSP